MWFLEDYKCTILIPCCHDAGNILITKHFTIMPCARAEEIHKNMQGKQIVWTLLPVLLNHEIFYYMYLSDIQE